MFHRCLWGIHVLETVITGLYLQASSHVILGQWILKPSFLALTNNLNEELAWLWWSPLGKQKDSKCCAGSVSLKMSLETSRNCKLEIWLLILAPSQNTTAALCSPQFEIMSCPKKHFDSIHENSASSIN